MLKAFSSFFLTPSVNPPDHWDGNVLFSSSSRRYREALSANMGGHFLVGRAAKGIEKKKGERGTRGTIKDFCVIVAPLVMASPPLPSPITLQGP